MTNVANSRFNITGWDEKPYSEGPDLPKLTRAASPRRSPAISPAKGMSNT